MKITMADSKAGVAGGRLDAAAVEGRTKGTQGTQGTEGTRKSPIANSQGELRHVAVGEIAVGNTNPRKRWHKEQQAELVASVRAVGIVQPLLLRPRPPKGGTPNAPSTLDPRPSTPYELVAGERRLKAAIEAGLATVPAYVRELSDAEAMELQVIENDQREDLHPLEEAEGYERLMKETGCSGYALAEKLGRKPAHVFARLKLLALCPKARETLWTDRISHSLALLIARIPAVKLQEEALKEVGPDGWRDQAMGVREAAELIQRRWMLKLREAPWKLTDAALDAAAGACVDCPRRTGNQREVFGDVLANKGGADLCTDPVCYERKQAAWTKRRLAEARAAGQEVLAEGEKLFDRYRPEALGAGTGYVDLAERCDKLGWDHQGSWKKTLGKAAVDPVLAVDPKGNVHELVPRKAAMAALREAGHEVESGGTGDGEAARAQSRAAAKRTKERRGVAERATGRLLGEDGSEHGEDLVDLLLSPQSSAAKAKLWQRLARAAYEATSIDRHDFVAKRRGWAASQTEARGAIDRWLEGKGAGSGEGKSQIANRKSQIEPRTAEEWAGFVLEVLLCAAWGGWEGNFTKEFRDLCAGAGVDLKEMEKEGTNRTDGAKGTEGEYGLNKDGVFLKPEVLKVPLKGKFTAKIYLAKWMGCWVSGRDVEKKGTAVGCGAESGLPSKKGGKAWGSRAVAIGQEAVAICGFLRTHGGNEKARLAVLEWARGQGATVKE